MCMLRNVVVAALALVLLTSAADAADKAKKKKNNKGVRGTVVSVEKDSLKVKVMMGKKGAVETAEKTFKLGENVKVEKVTGKKADRQVTAAKIEDVTKDSRVVIKANGEQIESIQVLAGKVKKKKNQ